MGTDAHVRLLLFSSLIALTAEAYPVRYRIMPSPIQKYRSTRFAYPHRKLSRPWLAKLQEELWRDGPSGDGPEEDGRSSLISPIASYGNQASKTDYKTHSPSAEDFLSHQTEPFPTIIDTMMDESSSFADEFVSRTSLLYEGPSSLLNSFIFRPFLPYSPLSSIKTPVIEESSDFQNVIPTWMDESTGSRVMSPRQALSETVFNEFVLITAISATNIESEATLTHLTTVSFSTLPSELPSNFTLEKSSTESKNATEVFSSLGEIRIIQTRSVYFDENQFYTEGTVLLTSYQFSDAHSSEIIRPVITSPISFSSDVPVNFLESSFHSNILTEMPHKSTYSHSHVFYQTSDLPSLAHTSVMTDFYFSQTHKLDNSFSTDVLYTPDRTFYTKVPFKSLLSSNVQTLATVVQDENTSDIFITPLSEDYGVLITHTSFSTDVQEINPSLEYSKLENPFSSILASFTDFNEVVPVVSFLPIDSITTVENIISREDTMAYLKTISHFDISKEPRDISDFERSHPFQSSIRTFLFDNEGVFNKRNSIEEFKPFLSEEMGESLTDITPPIPFIPSYAASDAISTEQTFIKIESSTKMVNRKSDINEIASNRVQDDIISTSLNLLINSQMPHKITDLTSVTCATIPGVVYSKQSFSEIFSSKVKQSYSPYQTMTSTTVSITGIMSINDISGKEFLSEFSTEFIDPSTHHVTARSLSGNSFTDVKESISPLIDISASDTDTDSSTVTSENIFTFVSGSIDELKSGKTFLTSNHLTSTIRFDETFKTTESAFNYFPHTMTISELSGCCFETSLLQENSQIHPSVTILFSEKPYREITPKNIFASQTSEDEIYKGVLESTLSDMRINPTATLLFSQNVKDGDIYTSSESLNTLNGQTTDPSQKFSYFSVIEPDIIALSNQPQIDTYGASDIPYTRKKSSDDYLNEHLLSSSHRNLIKHLYPDESYSNTELHTRTITFKTGNDTASEIIGASFNDFTNLVTDQSNVQLKSNDINVSSTYVSPYSISKYIASQIDSESFDDGIIKSIEIQSSISDENHISHFTDFKTSPTTSDFRHFYGSVKTDVSYRFYSEFPTPSVHYHSTLDEAFDINDISSTHFSSSPSTQISTEINYFPVILTSHSEKDEYTSFIFKTVEYPDISSNLQEIDSSRITVSDSDDKLAQLTTIKRESSVIYDLYSKTLPIMLDSSFSPISSSFADEESSIYRPIHQTTQYPYPPATDWTTYTSSKIFPSYIDSAVRFVSTLSPVEESQFDLHTPDLIFFNRVSSNGASKYLETSAVLVQDFASMKESFDQIPYQINSSEATSYDKSLENGDLLLATKTTFLSSDIPFSNFTLTNDSMFFSGPEITPTKTLQQENILVTSQKLTNGELHSKIYSDGLNAFAYSSPKLNFEQDTVFYQHTPELTPSLSMTAFEQSSCEFPSCPTDSKLASGTPDISLPKSDIKVIISPTLLPGIENEAKGLFTSQGPISLSKIGSSDSRRVTISESIKQSYTIRKTDIESKDSVYTYKTIHYSSRQLGIKTIDSDYLIKTTPTTPFVVTTSVDHLSASSLISEGVGTLKSSTVFSKNDTASTSSKESSTPGYDIEMASVLAISSFFGANSSRNASSGFENSGISEDDWSKSDVKPTPSLDLTLFKDNNYWILTVLETPIKGHLPENFSHTLEIRLANAYSEAFRQRYPRKEGSTEPIIVKILSLTKDLLLSQLNVVYVVEKGGILLAAEIAADLFNFLRHEQLREFLGLYAILKAKPYRPDEVPEAKAISPTIPVVTIVCSILGFLLLLFCCFCVYCRCCRPKQESDASPTSSASGSLQRSLAKHGQHNRKHLFQEMAHHLTTEIVAAHRKIESPAKDLYFPEKEPPPPGKKLPPLPATEQAEAIDKAARMLKILENKDIATSPISQKRSRIKHDLCPDETNAFECKKSLPKPKKRKKPKEEEEKKSTKTIKKGDKRNSRPSSHVPKKEKLASSTKENRESPDSGTSSRHTSTSPVSVTEKMSEEAGSDSSNIELLPPVRDLIAKSKADSQAVEADTQDHLSRVRQRISEILDDAFALANGRKFYGSMRSKKIDPATQMFPRYGSLRSQSAAECSLTRHEENLEDEKRRPISEGAQNLLGTITDDGQLITKPQPKLVWDHAEFEDSISDATKHPEVTEAHNRHVNFFPFQQLSKQQQIQSSTSSSLPIADMQHKSPTDMTSSMQSTRNALREVASEIYPAHSSKIHPAAIDNYDEKESALKENEPVVELIQAIKDELQKFSGSVSGTHSNESNA